MTKLLTKRFLGIVISGLIVILSELKVHAGFGGVFARACDMRVGKG